MILMIVNSIGFTKFILFHYKNQHVNVNKLQNKFKSTYLNLFLISKNHQQHNNENNYYNPLKNVIGDSM
jgi:hypothetical protein